MTAQLAHGTSPYVLRGMPTQLPLMTVQLAHGAHGSNAVTGLRAEGRQLLALLVRLYCLKDACVEQRSAPSLAPSGAISPNLCALGLRMRILPIVMTITNAQMFMRTGV